MGISLGLAAAFGFGTADFLARFATREIGAYRTSFYMGFIGGGALTVYLVASGELARLAASVSWDVWVGACGFGLLNMVSGLALYRAFEVGMLTIVSPIASSYAALTFFLSLLSGETHTPARTVGLIVTLVGVVLAAASLEPHETPSGTWRRANSRLHIPPGVGWAATAAVGFGVSLWFLGFHLTPRLGGVAPVWVSRLVSIGAMPLLAIPLRQNINLPRGRVWRGIASVSVLDTAGFVAVSVGQTTDQVAVVSVLASLFSAVTVLLAWIFLRERLRASQWVGVLLILIGVALVSV